MLTKNDELVEEPQDDPFGDDKEDVDEESLEEPTDDVQDHGQPQENVEPPIDNVELMKPSIEIPSVDIVEEVEAAPGLTLNLEHEREVSVTKSEELLSTHNAESELEVTEDAVIKSINIL
jgi:hypothetical protein